VREDFWTKTSNKQLNFVQHMLSLLRINGHAAVVLPGKVLFFDRKEDRPSAWTEKLWVYDLRTSEHFTQKQSPITRRDFDEFVACCRAGEVHKREPRWSEANPDGRMRRLAISACHRRMAFLDI